jgi:hypothetical protein
MIAMHKITLNGTTGSMMFYVERITSSKYRSHYANKIGEEYEPFYIAREEDDKLDLLKFAHADFIATYREYVQSVENETSDIYTREQIKEEFKCPVAEV